MSDFPFSSDYQTIQPSAEVHEHTSENANLIPCTVIQAADNCHDDRNGIPSLFTAKDSRYYRQLRWIQF